MKDTPKKRNYRRYDEEFKRNAVALLSNGRSIKSVALSLGIDKRNLYAWRKEYGSKNTANEMKDLEIQRLEKLLKEVTQERDILKKALQIFSRVT